MKSKSTRVLVERDTLGTTVQYVRLYTDVQCFVFGQLEKFFEKKGFLKLISDLLLKVLLYEINWSLMLLPDIDGFSPKPS